ncbi:MAG TPA: response regulator [Polyangiaceae bacterium]|jgi:CheY-like chemotaxis protein|nr:response regulator [Polyangiaceae bacterium]
MPRILLIDDDDIAREFLASLLRDGGHQVFELPSPIGATRAILNNAIDVVVLDIFMPQMDGDKSAKMLRENPRLSGIAIVLVSSCDPVQLEEIAARVRANAVVSKADAREKLVATVNRLGRTSNRPASAGRLTAPREPGKLS